MSDVAFETTRLRLRRLAPEDVTALFEVFADPDARRFYPQMAEVQHVRGWIDWNRRNYQQHGFGLWALELKPSGEFIGDCGLTYQQVEGQSELEIGYHVHHAMRRNGYATEAARACLDYAFEHTACDSVCSIVSPPNEASRAVAGRVHAECREFERRGQSRLLYFTTRRAWEQARGAEGA